MYGTTLRVVNRGTLCRAVLIDFGSVFLLSSVRRRHLFGIEFNGELWELQVTEVQEQFLREQSIRKGEPRTILIDFETLIEFIAKTD